MQFFKNVFARVYCIYAITLFVISLVPVYLFLRLVKIVLPSGQFMKVFHNTTRVWMGAYLPMVFCPVKVSGKQKFEKGQNYVVVFNHSSLIDIPVSTPGISGANKTLGKSEFLKAPLFGFIYKCGSVIINRKNPRSRQASYQEMLQVLQTDLHVCLYPEGTRNKSAEKLLPFKDGAFKLAIESQKPIMIGVIKGTKNILHPTKIFYAWPCAIEINYLKVLPITDIAYADANTLKHKAYEIMKQAL